MPEEKSWARGWTLKKRTAQLLCRPVSLLARQDPVTLSATSDQLRVSWVIAALIVILIYLVQEHLHLSTGSVVTWS